ncbi:IS481 family transposase [Microbacterium sp. USHLN186]|uniref:IS481 family transposase n=1 Tax=Microbacterium sp. USHLN186 TaxID=3081286 RepID=UPI0030187C98
MAKYEILIKAVTVQHRSYGEVAARYGVSKTLVHKLHHRWLTEGEAAYQPRSRRPRSTPNRTPESVRLRVIALRDELTAQGLDAGADTIAAHLSHEKTHLSRTTIWRILTATGKVSPQPQKRPRSSWRRFAADRPNELWQSDFTHVTLTDGTDTEVIGWIDDHSRYMLHLSAHRRVTGRTVTDTFTDTAARHGYPTATLTDNGMVYTTRLARGGRGRPDGAGNGFETLLADLGITQKNGKPFKPTTQGKIERFWQTLKKYLHAHPAASLTQLQTTLDTFRDYYNNTRPHRGIGRRTPAFAYELIPKAAPTQPADPNIWRVRYDTIDNDGKITLRRSGRLLHLGIGRAHARTEIICLVHNSNATIITLNTGELIAEFTLDPTKNYQRKND